MTHDDFEEAQRLAGLVNITADNIHAAFRALKPGEEVAVARLFVKLVEAFGDVVDTLPPEHVYTLAADTESEGPC